MATCFIFMKYCTDKGALSLVLNDKAEIESPLEMRPLPELRALQAHAKTIIVLSTEQASLHKVELPKLSDKKAQAAIPFALEDKLADNIQDLHFAFDNRYYQDGHYLVVVCKLAYLLSILAELEKLQLSFQAITFDWFALHDNEACMMDTYLLVHNKDHFYGALPQELAENYLNTLDKEQVVHKFAKKSKAGCLWIAKRLMGGSYINVLQSSNADKTRPWVWAAGCMVGLWIISILLINSIKIVSLNAKIKAIDKDIAISYHYFFPKAQQVISPKFRISRLVGLQGKTEEQTFWVLLNQLSRAIAQNGSSVSQIQFQNNKVQVSIISKDFNTLEALQTALKKANVQVKQSEASSKDNAVIGSLELSL